MLHNVLNTKEQSNSINNSIIASIDFNLFNLDANINFNALLYKINNDIINF